MFRCELCGRNIGPRERQYRIVTKKREREYHYKDEELDEDKVSTGWEIVEEMAVCSDCARA